MTMIIAHNLSAINTQRNLTFSQGGLSKSMEKLSSGYRINVGADGPADLVISEQLRAQQSGLERAVRNTSEANNVIAIAEGALNEMNNILKKMKQLAIHSANSGVTSPQQIAADQSEMDSSIQTLDKIANTTRYSDQQLLNGNKQLTYTQTTTVRGTQQNQLVNGGMSAFDQVFRTKDYNVALSFTGSKDALVSTGTGTVDFSKQAMRAYLEVDTGAGTISQVDTSGNILQNQNFILTGSKGARNFKFDKGTPITTLVQEIHSSVGSTGIDASLVFNSDQRIDKTVSVTNARPPINYADGSGLVNAAGATFTANDITVSGTLPNRATARSGGLVSVSANADRTFTVDIDGLIVNETWNGSDPITITEGDWAGLTINLNNDFDISNTFDTKITAYTVPAGPVTSNAWSDGTNTATVAITPGTTNLEQMYELGIASIGLEYGAATAGGNTTVTLVGYDAKGNKVHSETASITAWGSPTFDTSGPFAGTLLAITDNGVATATAKGSVKNAVPSITYDLSAAKSTIIQFSEVQHEDTTAAGAAGTGQCVGGLGQARAAGTVAVFGNTVQDSTGVVTQGVSGVTITKDTIQYGLNTDGQGRIFVKFTGSGNYELYKDSSMSVESLVGYGVNGQPCTEVNNSKLGGITLNLAGGNDLVGKKGVYLSMAGIEGLNDGITLGGNLGGNGANGTGTFDAANTYVSGVELGKNTDDLGKIYTRTVVNGGKVQVFAYKNADCLDKDLVAKSAVYDMNDPATTAATIVLNEIRNSDNSSGTGLGIVVSFAGDAFRNVQDGTIPGEIAFTNLAARIYSEEYGSQEGIKVQQFEGALFTYYQSQEDVNSRALIDAGANGILMELYGQDATLSVNGQQVYTDGLNLKLATQDLQARLLFNQGRVGSTTIAQVGYGDGSLFSRIGALNLGSANVQTEDGLSGLLCNAGHNTNEKVGNFSNGMQLQLGEGEGDQERTVLSINSMSIANMGRVVKGGYWETGNSVYTEKSFCMQDILGGGLASLQEDPILAMQIIEQAINDVSDLRARLGAVQSNLLQTNMNNLSVAIENITKTESAIRDTDMAAEMTDFTKNQILQNAGMSMLAQANQAQQSVLQLLQ